VAGGRLPRLSGRELLKIFCNRLGCAITRQRGSHANLIGTVKGVKVAFTIPLHEELDTGTLLSIVRDVGLSREEFLLLVRNK